jgi:hypothetical protein
MANHKKILYSTSYYLAIVTPKSIDANATFFAYTLIYFALIFHITINHHKGHNTIYQYNSLNSPTVTIDIHQKKYKKK